MMRGHIWKNSSKYIIHFFVWFSILVSIEWISDHGRIYPCLFVKYLTNIFVAFEFEGYGLHFFWLYNWTFYYYLRKIEQKIRYFVKIFLKIFNELEYSLSKFIYNYSFPHKSIWTYYHPNHSRQQSTLQNQICDSQILSRSIHKRCYCSHTEVAFYQSLTIKENLASSS